MQNNTAISSIIPARILESSAQQKPSLLVNIAHCSLSMTTEQRCTETQPAYMSAVSYTDIEYRSINCLGTAPGSRSQLIPPLIVVASCESCRLEDARTFRNPRKARVVTVQVACFIVRA
ncbi:hypothetical protein RRG08_043122 [Elysia crispata]|uniref:Uncharacterized protein n=1 Tax=Elysia crispata TaxID=231223 RepID=A0AAE1CPI5_9GAST|nr:hypothetical protein RRG08_043122 [Elysia crispata]